MKDKKVEKCLNVFDDYRCQRPAGHHGTKHWDDRNNSWIGWTDAGKKRILQERERQKK